MTIFKIRVDPSMDSFGVRINPHSYEQLIAEFGSSPLHAFAPPNLDLQGPLVVLQREDEEVNTITLNAGTKALLFPGKDSIAVTGKRPTILPKTNLLNCEQLTDSTPVSQVIKIRFLRKLFESRCLWLVQPHSWEDSYENFLYKCSLAGGNGRESISLESIKDSWFAQSWSLREDNDAQWRIYSTLTQDIDNASVRIHTTLGQLRRVCWDSSDQFSALTYCIGRVSYVTEQQIGRFLDKFRFSEYVSGGQIRSSASALLLKREAFKHEEELRILAFVTSDDAKARVVVEGGRSLFKLPIEPNTFISHVLLDPRLKDSDIPRFAETIRQLGYPGSVSKSPLYSFTPRVLAI